MNDYIMDQIYLYIEALPPKSKLSSPLLLLIIMAISEGKIPIHDAVELFDDNLDVLKAE